MLAEIPVGFRAAAIGGITPETNRHPKQADAIRTVTENPDGNYFLVGRYGSGKSHLFWALYRHAVESGRSCYGGTLRGLIDAFQRAFNRKDGEDRYFPPISAEDLKRGDRRFGLFLDDIDKARPTEYVAEQFFELLDAAHSYGHQIVITANLGAGDLVRHFERADDTGRFGGAIVRRLVSNSREINLF